MHTNKDKKLSSVALKSKMQMVQLDIRMANEVVKAKKEVAQLELLIAKIAFSLVLSMTLFAIIFFGLKGVVYIAFIVIALIIIMFVLHVLFLQYKNRQLQTVLNRNIDSLLDASKAVAVPLSAKKAVPKAPTKAIVYEKLDTSFLNEYKALKRTYDDINDCYARYKKTDLDERESIHADNLMIVSNEVVKQLKVSYDLNGGEANKLVPYIIPADSAFLKLKAVHEELSKAIKRKNLKIASRLEKLVLPKYLELENTLDDLRVRSARLLRSLNADPLYKNSEEKIILTKIVGHRLNELWLTYTNAIKEDSAGDSTTERVKNPDDVLSEIFAEIDGFLNRLESGVNDSQKNQAMNKLLTNQRYFKDRFS